MCGIRDWQSTIVKDLNNSQDPKHTLLCRENAFVAINALFSGNKCLLFSLLGGEGHPKRTLPTFFYRFWQNYTLLEQKGMVFDIFINC